MEIVIKRIAQIEKKANLLLNNCILSMETKLCWN